jgi:hypothetical protein
MGLHPYRYEAEDAATTPSNMWRGDRLVRRLLGMSGALYLAPPREWLAADERPPLLLRVVQGQRSVVSVDLRS